MHEGAKKKFASTVPQRSCGSGDNIEEEPRRNTWCILSRPKVVQDQAGMRGNLRAVGAAWMHSARLRVECRDAAPASGKYTRIPAWSWTTWEPLNIHQVFLPGCSERVSDFLAPSARGRTRKWSHVLIGSIV